MIEVKVDKDGYPLFMKNDPRYRKYEPTQEDVDKLVQAIEDDLYNKLVKRHATDYEQTIEDH